MIIRRPTRTKPKPRTFTADSKHVDKVIPASAGNIGPARNRHSITLLVIHSAETGELAQAAENVGGYFASGSGGRKASTHYGADSNTTCQYVPELHLAWGAANANKNGIHIEIAGRAAQTSAQWADPYSQATLARVVILCGDILRRHPTIPLVLLDAKAVAAALKAGRRPAGIVTHAALSEGSKRAGLPSSSHWDPGKGFPLQATFNRMVAASGRAL